MKEYIERAAAMDAILGLTIADPAVAQYADAVCYHLQNLPAADVAPVRHGSWVFDHMTGERAYCANCSECGNRKHFVNQEAAQKEKYCSLCGAHMDKEDEQ